VSWDLTAFFASFAGDEYRDFRAQLERDLASLLEESRTLGALSRESSNAWAELLVRLENATARSAHLASYLGCLSAADSRDEAVAREVASATSARSAQEKVYVLVREALRSADEELFDVLCADPRLESARYFLQRVRERARWSMGNAEENLAADLEPSGLAAWGRLYGNVSGKLVFELALPGQATRHLPVSMTRTLLEDPDPVVRRAAFHGANAAWARTADVTAACLNAISGTRLALYARRGVGHFLEPALFDAAISRETLDAMLDSVRARAGIARRYLRRKAERLGRERLGFPDLLAPLPRADGARVSWAEARAEIESAFGASYPALAALAHRAFERNWIDWETRPGKRPGGFCSGSSLIDESRIFLTFNGAPGDTSTLAHELGHAFHGERMAGTRFWARRSPMTLAETASTFAEQILIDAAQARARDSHEDRLAILDGRLQDAAVFLLNIPARFSFEKALYEERAHGELAVSRLCALMLDAEREWYGDALDPDDLDPWFWASKLHFYITSISFYNFPYTFGYLFSLGIFARAKREGPGFLPRYEALLRSTGGASAEQVAQGALGVDLRKPDFWNASLDLIEENLDEYLNAAQV
jgi:oligoendopeptidase F